MRRRVLLLVLLLVAAVGCSGGGPRDDGALVISAIPDQDPQVLQRQYSTFAEALSTRLGVPVRYVPVTDYTASVTAFRRGDLDLVFFGGLTGLQARAQVPDARYVAQRDVDQDFTSVFVAAADSGIGPLPDVAALSAFRGRTFTFGSETSTSGRLMPQSFLLQAGVGPDAFAGAPGFSGSHDRTIALVSAGAFQGGALNSRVWDERVRQGRVDTTRVREVFRTPPYHDYHFLARPDLDARLGDGFTDRLTATVLGLRASDPQDRRVLDLFSAGAFVPTGPGNYVVIADVARRLGLLR